MTLLSRSLTAWPATAVSMSVAAFLRALFDDEPGGWESLAWINLGPNDAEVDFRGFLSSWNERAPKRNQGFIEKILRLIRL